MKKELIMITLLIILLQNQTYSQFSKAIFVKYKIIVRDEYLKPIKDILVECTIYNKEDKTNQAQIIKEQEYTTNEFGEIIDSIKLENREGSWYYGSIYYSVHDKSFCTNRGKKIISKYIKNQSDLNEIIDINIDLIKPSPLIHNIKFYVKNRQGIPLESAKIELTNKVVNSVVEEEVITTDINGKASVKVIHNKGYDLCDESIRSNRLSKLDFIIRKDGYFNYFGTKEQSSRIIQDDDIILIHESDYFDKDFYRLSKNKYALEKILSIMNIIRLQSIIKDCLPKYDFIRLEKFKDKSYLSFGFQELNTYNSLKMNHYDIAKIVFDEVVRKMLTHLNQYLSDIKDIDGYRLNITTKTRNFLDKNISSKSLSYDFYFLKKDVFDYKNNDITGQQLIDKSIILFNDERIDLKLQ